MVNAKLLKKLEAYRKQMHFEAETKGLNHQDVLKISKKIDQLHNQINNNEYSQITSDSNKFSFIKTSAI